MVAKQWHPFGGVGAWGQILLFPIDSDGRPYSSLRLACGLQFLQGVSIAACDADALS